MKTQTEARPVCAGQPPKFPQHTPTVMYKSGYTPKPDSQPRFKCSICGRTVSGRNAEALLTMVSTEQPITPRVRRKKKRRPSKGMYDL